jgi:hypothetical protein
MTMLCRRNNVKQNLYLINLKILVFLGQCPVELFCCRCFCIAVKRKNIGFIHLHQSQNNCIGFVNPVLQYGVRLEDETQLAPSICVALTVYLLPPPLHASAEMRGELYILNPDEEFLIAQ